MNYKIQCLFKKINTDVSVRIKKDVNKSFTIFLLFNLLFTKKANCLKLMLQRRLFGVFLMNGTFSFSLCVTKCA